MTVDQTRQLGIEFERRIQQIYPAFVSEQKLDTDTIYSFLNQFQNRYIKTLFLNNNHDQKSQEIGIEETYINDMLKPFIKRFNDVPEKDASENTLWKIQLPNDYFYYIRSFDTISKSYKKQDDNYSQDEITYNKIISQTDAKLVQNTYYNKGAIILNPYVILDNFDSNGPYLQIITDQYTKLEMVYLIYLRCPYRFNILNYDNTKTDIGSTHNACELPYTCFNELVEGAVELFITENKFRLQMKSNDNGQQPQQEQNKQEDNQ